MKKNILSILITASVSISLLSPIVADAQTYSVERAQDHKQRAEESMKQTMLIHDRERSQDLVTLWIAPYGECEDTTADGSENNPFCDISQASKALDSMYAQGKARGDIDIRFKTGNNRIYKPKIGESYGTFTFSPTAGHVVRFIPDWYENIKDLENIPDDKYIKFQGHDRNTTKYESEVAFNIVPSLNRGGTFQISGFSFETFVDALRISSVIRETDGNEDIKKNIKYGINASIDRSLISHNKFNRIGTTYTKAKAEEKGTYVIAFSSKVENATNMLFSNNIITNSSALEEHQGGSHVTYDYINSDGIYVDNIIDEFDYSGFQLRMSSDSIIMNNTFKNSNKTPSNHPRYSILPYEKAIGTFYQGISLEDRPNFAECKNDGPYYKYLNNTFDMAPPKIYIDDTKQQQYCENSNRITAPMFVEGVQTGDFEYSIRWGESDTNGDGVKAYHVYVGNIDSKGYPVEEATLLKTVNDKTRELTMTKDMLEKSGMKPGQDFYYYLIAEGNSGWTSGRTQHRMTINLDEKYKGREYYRVARSESFDRLIGGKKPEKSTFSYDLVSDKLNPSYGEKNVNTGAKVSQKISLDKLPVYTTFSILDSEEFPGKVSVNAKTGELTVDTQGVKDGEYTINVEVQYGDWSKDVAPLVLRINNENEVEDPTDITQTEAETTTETNTDSPDEVVASLSTEPTTQLESTPESIPSELEEDDGDVQDSTTTFYEGEPTSENNIPGEDKTVSQQVNMSSHTSSSTPKDEDTSVSATTTTSVINTDSRQENIGLEPFSPQQKITSTDNQYVDEKIHGGISENSHNISTLDNTHHDNVQQAPVIRSNNAIRQTVHSQGNPFNDHSFDFYSVNVKKVGPTVHTGGQVESSSWIQEAIQKIKIVFKTRV